MKTIIAISSIILCLSSCAHDTTGAITETELNLKKTVESQSQGYMSVIGFNKTNGYESSTSGTDGYTVEWTATLEAKEHVYKNGNDLEGYWGNFNVLTQKPGFWDAYGNGSTPKEYTQGAHIELNGKTMLIESDNGWQVQKMQVISSSDK